MKKYEFLVYFPNPDDTAVFRITAPNQAEAWREFFSEVSTYDFLNSAIFIKLFNFDFGDEK